MSKKKQSIWHKKQSKIMSSKILKTNKTFRNKEVDEDENDKMRLFAKKFSQEIKKAVRD